MKTKKGVKFFLVLILCLGIGVTASNLYAQKKKAYAYGDTGIPHDYFDKMKDLIGAATHFIRYSSILLAFSFFSA